MRSIVTVALSGHYAVADGYPLYRRGARVDMAITARPVLPPMGWAYVQIERLEAGAWRRIAVYGAYPLEATGRRATWVVPQTPGTFRARVV